MLGPMCTWQGRSMLGKFGPRHPHPSPGPLNRPLCLGYLQPGDHSRAVPLGKGHSFPAGIFKQLVSCRKRDRLSSPSLSLHPTDSQGQGLCPGSSAPSPGPEAVRHRDTQKPSRPRHSALPEPQPDLPSVTTRHSRPSPERALLGSGHLGSGPGSPGDRPRRAAARPVALTSSSAAGPSLPGSPAWQAARARSLSA